MSSLARPISCWIAWPWRTEVAEVRQNSPLSLVDESADESAFGEKTSVAFENA